jgi:cell fate (sporulation/competence/biofilm development) regulator YlbF (YheA/YmcA/DUF963 family)
VLYYAAAPHGLSRPGTGATTKRNMLAQTDGSAVAEKTRELCQALLDQPNMTSIRGRISAFMSDETSRAQYESIVTKGRALNEKQQQAVPLSGEEVAEFEQHRETLLSNPVARGFLDAQEELRHLQESIQQHVSKTLELGRLPGPEDFHNGSCGDHDCGCQH